MAPSTRSMLAAINTLLSPRDQASPNMLTFSPSEATVPEDMTTGGSSEALIAQDKLPDGPTLWDSLDSRLTTTDANNKAFQHYVISILDEMKSSINAPGNTTAPTVHCPTTTPSVVPPVLCPVTNPSWAVQPNIHLPLIKDPWPMLSDIKEFESWRSLILTRIVSSEVNCAYDSTTDDLIDFLPPTYDCQLAARLMGCLPLSNSFHSRGDIRGRGIKIWQELNSAYDKEVSFLYTSSQLSEFWTTLIRDPAENIDEYYNRFKRMLRRINSHEDAPMFSDKRIRKHFLLTLGPGFEDMITKEKYNQLDTKYITWTWSELLFDLRQIHTNITMLPPSTKATAGSMGYALVNAVNTHTADAATIKALEDKLAILEKAKEKADAAAIKKKLEAKAALANGPDFYCHTHGFGKNPLHTSGTCINRSPGHNEYATATDTMGGSTYKRK